MGLWALALVACGSSSGAAPGGSSSAGHRDGGASSSSRDGSATTTSATTTSSSSTSVTSAANDGGSGSSPALGGCTLFPANHIFNTPIDSLPVHPSSAAFLTTIGNHNLHLDLGQTVDPTSSTYYGIPYNVVHGAALGWTTVSYGSVDPNLSWDPRAEADCATGASHALVAPCTAASAPQPLFPIPASPLVEGGIVTDPAQPYGDHHLLLLDADSCRLWELFHTYPDPTTNWDIFGSASFDLRSNALRPAGWTSADAAGFPILPLLLRADEASSGTIAHALRFTITSSKIRSTYVWPARHLTTNGTSSTDLPPMGQAFRLKASFAIPPSYNVQSRAILQAMKTYGIYIADGGSDMYVTGEPSASWADDTFTQVQSVGSGEFEAVDLSPIMARSGFNPDSAAVPP